MTRRNANALRLTPCVADKKRAARNAEHRARPAIPITVLSIDPGATSGYALLSSTGEVLDIGTVDVSTRQLEAVLAKAVDVSGIDPVALVTETWGTGGPLGIDQWLGLAAARGAWERTHKLVSTPESFHIRVAVSTWRGTMVDATRTESGKRFDSARWKRECRATAVLQHGIPEALATPDAAEAYLMGYYAQRSAELAAALPPAYAKRLGLDLAPWTK